MASCLMGIKMLVCKELLQFLFLEVSLVNTRIFEILNCHSHIGMCKSAISR